MNKNFVHTKGKILFSIFLTAFLLIGAVTTGIVFTGSQHTYSTNKGDVAAVSSETTYFYVDPPEVVGVMPDDIFLININVTEVPKTFAWEIQLSWDPSLLKVFYKREGDFLKRGVYETYFTVSPFDEANLNGQIAATCTLLGDVPGEEWASGSGWLVSLGFNVTGLGSSVLNLFDTRLWDYVLEADPAYTYHPNIDSFFYNEPFHDIAVDNVARNVTEMWVDEPLNVGINVTITNKGNYTETSETFNVTVYADVNASEYAYDKLGRLIKTTIDVGNEIVVGTQTLTESLALGATTTLNFTWDTTEVASGNYTISAEVMGDDDTRDNLFIDGTVMIKAVLVHDIAVTNVTASPTEVTIGENVTINVTVENEGNFNETFDVTVYYDDIAIANQTNIALANGTSTSAPLAFTWNTTGVPEGTYTISATASVVEEETDIADNTFIDGTVRIHGASAPNIFLYAAAGTAIIIVAAVVIYIVKFRKRAG